jgi:hypothetical protein
MTNEPVSERREAGHEDWNITLFDLRTSVPDEALDTAPAPRGGGMPRRYMDYRPLEGQDVVDFLIAAGVPVGAHDLTTADWAARSLDPATLLTVLSWVRRASASGST